MFLTLHLKRSRFQKVARSSKKVLNIFMYWCYAGLGQSKTFNATVKIANSKHFFALHLMQTFIYTLYLPP